MGGSSRNRRSDSGNSRSTRQSRASRGSSKENKLSIDELLLQHTKSIRKRITSDRPDLKIGSLLDNMLFFVVSVAVTAMPIYVYTQPAFALVLEGEQSTIWTWLCGVTLLGSFALQYGYARTAEIVLNITLDALSGDFSGVEATDGGFGRQLGGAVRAARAGGDGSNDEDGAEIHFHKAKQRERAFLHRARVRSIAMALFLNNFAFLGGFCSLHAGLIGRFVDTETFPARWHFALTVGLSAAAAPLLAVVSASAMG